MIDFPEGLACCKDGSPFSKGEGRVRVIGALWKRTPHLHPLPGGGEESCLWRFFQAIAGFDRNIFSIQKASSRLIVVGHASTPDTGLDVLGNGQAINRAQSAWESSKQESPPSSDHGSERRNRLPGNI